MSAVPTKDSGVYWLGEIPSHWIIAKLSDLANYINGAAFKPADWSDEGLPIVRIQNLTGASDKFNYFRGDKPSRYRVHNGDMLISWSASIGIFIWHGGEAWLNQHIFKVDGLSDQVTKDFFRFSLDCSVQAIVSETHGSTMKHIVRGAFLGIKVPLPPLAEQRAIAAYLDRETANIDALIAWTEQLNALLGEKRAALISHAVTKGLDPAAPLKDSGVVWLGEIPAHWDCGQVSKISQVKTGGTPKRENLDYWQGGTINWITSGAIHQRRVHEIESHITLKGLQNSNATMLPVHSVMIALSGQGKTKGMVATLDVSTTCSQALAAFICDTSRLHHNFLFYYLDSRYRAIRGLVGEKRDGLNLTRIKQIYIPLPPLAEQRAIAAYLDREAARIDALSAKNDRLIALLREKRTALISAAVTGTIDLRNEA